MSSSDRSLRNTRDPTNLCIFSHGSNCADGVIDLPEGDNPPLQAEGDDEVNVVSLACKQIRAEAIWQLIEADSKDLDLHPT